MCWQVSKVELSTWCSVCNWVCICVCLYVCVCLFVIPLGSVIMPQLVGFLASSSTSLSQSSCPPPLVQLMKRRRVYLNGKKVMKECTWLHRCYREENGRTIENWSLWWVLRVQDFTHAYPWCVPLLAILRFIYSKNNLAIWLTLKMTNAPVGNANPN